jgi:hypothetical protein
MKCDWCERDVFEEELDNPMYPPGSDDLVCLDCQNESVILAEET